MWVHCKQSCEKIQQKEEKEIGHITSFYDLQARDIDKNLVSFSSLKDKTVIIVNVASYCGYTEEHYRELVQLYDSYKKGGQTDLEILAFPCNQFGTSLKI